MVRLIERLDGVAVALLLVVAAAAQFAWPSGAAARRPHSAAVVISNATPKLDTTGAELDAHEGSIVYDAGQYWMVGNSYGCGYLWVRQPSTWCGFRTYSSPDLVHWTNRGAAFNPLATYWQQLCGYPSLGCFDARLIHDAAAGRWRMWFNSYSSRSGYVVMSAPSPGGPWTLNATPNLAVGNNNPGRGNGAGGLFLDADGTGYLVYTAWTSDGTDVIEQLDPHMVTGTGAHTHIVGTVSAEAPSMFRGPDGAYVITYDAPGCAWCGGVGTGYATASSPLGPWRVRAPISSLSCNGQASAAVAVLPGVTLWVTDQWTNTMPGPRGPGVPGWDGMSDINAVGHWNQTDAAQLWEPLTFGPGGALAPITCPDTITVAVPNG